MQMLSPIALIRINLQHDIKGFQVLFIESLLELKLNIASSIHTRVSPFQANEVIADLITPLDK